MAARVGRFASVARRAGAEAPATGFFGTTGWVLCPHAPEQYNAPRAHIAAITNAPTRIIITRNVTPSSSGTGTTMSGTPQLQMQHLFMIWYGTCATITIEARFAAIHALVARLPITVLLVLARYTASSWSSKLIPTVGATRLAAGAGNVWQGDNGSPTYGTHGHSPQRTTSMDPNTWNSQASSRHTNGTRGRR